jgi:transcriptional regulator with XRE-family HTH domain
MATKRNKEFDQVVFFDLLRKQLDMSDYKIAQKLKISRHYYSQYTTGRNSLKISTLCEWFQKLELDVFDCARMLEKACA